MSLSLANVQYCPVQMSQNLTRLDRHRTTFGRNSNSEITFDSKTSEQLLTAHCILQHAYFQRYNFNEAYQILRNNNYMTICNTSLLNIYSNNLCTSPIMKRSEAIVHCMHQLVSYRVLFGHLSHRNIQVLFPTVPVHQFLYSKYS